MVNVAKLREATANYFEALRYVENAGTPAEREASLKGERIANARLRNVVRESYGRELECVEFSTKWRESIVLHFVGGGCFTIDF